MLALAYARWLPTVVPELTFDETGPDGNVFIAATPSTPDLAVTVQPTGGFPQPTAAPTDLPTLQVLVRGPRIDPRPGLTLAQGIYDATTCLDRVVLDEAGPDEVRVIGTTALQSAPVAMGMDSGQRHEWSLNFMFRIHNPTLHRQGA